MHRAERGGSSSWNSIEESSNCESAPLSVLSAAPERTIESKEVSIEQHWKASCHRDRIPYLSIVTFISAGRHYHLQAA